MDARSFGRKLAESRNRAGWTQEELAERCNLHVRTVQRIEAGDVRPRAYTVRLLETALGESLAAGITHDQASDEYERFRTEYRRRRRLRIGIMVTALTLMIGVTLIAFLSWELFGMSKRTWAPFFYLVMFGLLIGIARIWRCPACNALLGDVFSSRHCPGCGLKLDDRD